jgi:hypothetical protein
MLGICSWAGKVIGSLKRIKVNGPMYGRTDSASGNPVPPCSKRNTNLKLGSSTELS